MESVILTKVRNADDIIESFVRHHASIASRFVIILHRSTDDTRSIIESLKNEGLPIEIRFDEREEHNHARAINEVLNELRNEQPDYIFLLDSDEFIVGGKNVFETFSAEDSKILYLPWRTYVPTSADDASVDLPYRIEHCRNVEPQQFYKVCVKGAALQCIEGVTEGNHDVWLKPEQFVRKQQIDSPYIAHFPVRSPQQILGKIKSHWQARLANPNRKQAHSFHIKMLYDVFRDRTTLTPEETEEIARIYAVPVALQSEPIHLLHRPIPNSAFEC